MDWLLVQKCKNLDVISGTRVYVECRGPHPPGQNSQRSGYSDINKPSEAADPQASLSIEKLRKRQSHSTAKKQLSLKKSAKRVSKQKLYSKKKTKKNKKNRITQACVQNVVSSEIVQRTNNWIPIG